MTAYEEIDAQWDRRYKDFTKNWDEYTAGYLAGLEYALNKIEEEKEQEQK